MEVKSARGKHKIAESKRNKLRVQKFFEDNNNAGISACQRSLDLSYTTVRKHIDAILGEEIRGK